MGRAHRHGSRDNYDPPPILRLRCQRLYYFLLGKQTRLLQARAPGGPRHGWELSSGCSAAFDRCLESYSSRQPPFVYHGDCHVYVGSRAELSRSTMIDSLLGPPRRTSTRESAFTYGLWKGSSMRSRRGRSVSAGIRWYPAIACCYARRDRLPARETVRPESAFKLKCKELHLSAASFAQVLGP